MKKKTSGSLILAIILIILAATVAVAVTNWDSLKHYFETVRMMETTGELARWSDEDKVKLLKPWWMQASLIHRMPTCKQPWM